MEQLRTVYKYIAKCLMIWSGDSVKTHLLPDKSQGRVVSFSSVYAKAQLQQERTGTDAVSNFSHPSVCTVLNDWGALWSRAAILPHYQTKLGGELPPSPPCLPFPRSPLPHTYTLPHPHVCLWCLSGTGPVSGENKASGR